MSTLPVPSSSSSTRTSDSLVVRFTRALRLTPRTSRTFGSRLNLPVWPCPLAGRIRGHLEQCLFERGHLSRRPDADPEPGRRPGLTNQYTAVEQTLPDSVSIGELAEQHEVGVGV